jgi:pyruvate-formate lyase-activating enzyme
VIAVSVTVDRVECLESDLCQVFGGGHTVQDHRLVAGQRREKIDDGMVTAVSQKSVVPAVDQMRFRQILDLGKIHDHAIGGIAFLVDHIAGQGDFDGVAMAVQMPALALVVRDTVPGIELESAGNEHGEIVEKMSGRLYNVAMLTIADHRRDSAGLTYVYPVISRRAGGVSVGINLNTNNACNWGCLYCQVENLQRGGPLPIDLDALEQELAGFLDWALNGDFMAAQVPDGARQLVDVAFSGNGEPTTASEFPLVIPRVESVLGKFGLLGKLPVRLITNGSMMHRPQVQAAIAHLGKISGEVWFKLDRGDATEASVVNDVPTDMAKVQRNLAQCAALAPTWVQTCWFALDGVVPNAAARAAYCDFIHQFSGVVKGVHLYGLARPSMQPAAPRLRPLTAGELQAFGDEIETKTGIRVVVSP